MNEVIDWLPSYRQCGCDRTAVNCLSPGSWFERQTPIWHFDRKEIFSDFERYSRKVHPATFHRALARRIIETYSHKGETVLDIFCGSGTTLVAALETGRNAIGIDLNPGYVGLVRRRLDYMLEPRVNPDLRAICLRSDAKRLSSILPKNSIDIMITSPPYWDMLKQRQSKRNLRSGRHLKSNYSDDRNDISNAGTLKMFLKDLFGIFCQVHRVLKPGGRAVIVTGDYRRRGRYIPLHSIYITGLKRIGFTLNNIIIWDRSNEYDLDLYSYPDRFITANGSMEYILDFSKIVTQCSPI